MKKTETKEQINKTIQELEQMTIWNTIDKNKIIKRLEQIKNKQKTEQWEPLMWTQNNSEYENKQEVKQ